MRRLSIVLSIFCAATLVGSCGGGGGSTPTGSSNVNISGVRAGRTTFGRTTPAEHCFSEGLVRVGGHSFSLTATVNQSGSSISGTLDWSDFRVLCSLQGTVMGNAFNWTQTSCSEPCTTFDWSSEAGRPCNLSVCMVAEQFTGVSGGGGGPLQGNFVLRWSTMDADTGQDLGEIEVTGLFDL